MAAPTHINGNFKQNGATGVSSDSITINGVTAGNLIVFYATWNGSNGGTVDVSDGTTTFQKGTLVAQSTVVWGQMFYLLSANGGNKTYTITWSTDVDYPGMTVSEFNASGAWSFDAQNTGSASSTSISTGNISTSGTSEVVYAGQGNDGGYSPSSPQINGSAGTVPNYGAGSDRVWYRLLSATFSNGAATATITTSPWVCNVIAFKAAGTASVTVTGTATASITEADIV